MFHGSGRRRAIIAEVARRSRYWMTDQATPLDSELLKREQAHLKDFGLQVLVVVMEEEHSEQLLMLWHANWAFWRLAFSGLLRKILDLRHDPRVAGANSKWHGFVSCCTLRRRSEPSLRCLRCSKCNGLLPYCSRL